jgi:dUTP pyrophosphatase
MPDHVEIKIRADKGAIIPEYQSVGAAGADIHAFLIEDIIIGPGEIKLVPTGLYFEISNGFEVQIRPRSGLALKHGITLLNSPGTIDSDYRGEIKIIMINAGREEFKIENGMRIAQMVIAKAYRARFVIIDELNSSMRNSGGFGHTGI